MRLTSLLAGLLLWGPALAQSVPPVTSAPTAAGQLANKGYVDGVVAGLSTALSPVAKSGSYADLLNKPTIPAPPPLASSTVPGLMKAGAGLICDGTGTCSVDSQIPVASSAAPVASDALVDTTGKSFTVQQLAAAVASINGSGSSGSTAPSSTPTPTPTPTPSGGPIPADGTLSGLPSTIVAGQPLSAGTYVPTTGNAPFLVLYKVAAAAEEGSRFTPYVMPGGTLSLLIPQTAGAYTVRGYDANTAGNKVYESAQFSVTAPPGALPAAPTQVTDTGATSSSVTMNWTATASSYRVLARPGIGSAYGSLVDTTVSTNSYTFTGRPASSSPRAVVIPQNANGSGTPSGQFLSSTTP